MSKHKMETGPVMKRLMGRTSRIAMIAVVMAALGALGIHARPWIGQRLMPKSPVAANNPATSMVPQTGAVSTTLKSNGFQPAAVTRAGQFTLSISNQSGVDGLSLVLKRDSGEQVRQISMPAGTSTWSDVIDLPAGGYTLVEVNNPAWLFHITVQ